MSGVSLKDLKDDVRVIKSTRLEERLGETLVGSYTRFVDGYFKQKLNSGEMQDFIPTLQFFLNACPDYKSDLLELYDNIMSGVKGVAEIPNSVKIAQAALFDSLCFVADFGTESGEPVYSLATMNFSLLYDLQVDFDMQSQVIKKNKEGFVKAYRIDVEYNNSEEEFTFKAVNARNFDIDEAKSDLDETKRFFVVPYIFVLRFMKLIEALLRKGHTIRVNQSSNFVEKVRFITNNESILANMCDSPEAVQGVSSRFFPLKGFFYAPLVGAPSTSAMVTNVNIFNIDAIAPAKQGDFEKYGVYKPTNVLEELIGEGLVMNKLSILQEEDKESYYQIVGNLVESEFASPIDVVKYMHTCSNDDVKDIYRLLGIDAELERRMKAINFGNPQKLSEDEINSLGDILKTRVCRVIIQKKDCTLSSILCTNNKEILKGIYGENYISIYEGLAVRFYNFLNELKSFTNVMTDEVAKDMLAKWGIVVADETISYIVANADVIANDVKKVSGLKARIFSDMGVDLKRSEAQTSREANSFMVRARGLSAYIDSVGKTHEYMKNIDLLKVVKAYAL